MTQDNFPTVGILGGGQLGRMLALAGIRMGVHMRFLAPEEAGPMAELGRQTVADWTDEGVLRQFAATCTVVTSESEWAPADRLAAVAPADVAVYPRPQTMQLIRHKGLQKDALRSAGLPLPEYARAATLDAARAAAGQFGYPVVLKKYTGSYDGYGNATVRDDNGLEQGWDQLADAEGLLVETWVPFERELAVLVARRADGAYVTYPVAHTIQKDHRCHIVIVPAAVPDAVTSEAIRIAHDAVEAVDGIGITAVELFALKDGRVLVNELAPRPHNTGHYSIEGCYTSQFENHLRAVLGWPLGDPSLRQAVAVMVNLLGERSGKPGLEGYADALSIPGVAVHVYGKEEVKPNRKMGHITVTGADRDEVLDRAMKAAAYIRL